MRVLMTGATGFIGSHVAEYLVSKGLKVGCIVRESSNLKNIENIDVEVLYGDICDYQLLENISKGYDAFVHIAGFSKDWGSYELFYDINVVGAKNVVRACKKNNIKNIIITSSISVYGEEDCHKIKSETSQLKSHYHYFLDKLFPCKMNYYRDTKRLEKENTTQFAEKNGINIKFIEPVWVFGEREFSSGFYEYMNTVKQKIPFMLGSCKNKFHVIYVKDLARAYYLLLKEELEGVNSFIIGNKSADKMDDIYRLFCKSMKVKKPFNITKGIVYPIGFIMELIYTIFRVKTPPLLTRGRVNMFYDNIEYSVEKSKNVLGFESEYSIEEGIERTVKWYKSKGLI